MGTDFTCIRENVDRELLDECIEHLEENSKVILEKSKIYALLGNEVRMKIVNIFLNYGRLCVCDLSDILKMNQSPISQHLRKLKDGGLLENKREGMTIFYFIAPDKRAQLEGIL